MSRGLKIYINFLIVLAALSAIAIIPGGTLTVLLISGMMLPLYGLPGFLVAASPTILIYGTSILPAWIALASPKQRYRLGLPAFLIPVAIAVVPGVASRLQVDGFATNFNAREFNESAQRKPKSIELVGDRFSGLFVYGEEVGDKYASCGDLCRRLLFSGEAEWVRMTLVPEIYNNRRSGITRTATYRVERRDECPQVYPSGAKIEPAFRDRLVAGDCLIVDKESKDEAEARLHILTSYFHRAYQIKPQWPLPTIAIVDAVRDLDIWERREGALAPIVSMTYISALTISLPFYIGAEMHMQGGYNGPAIGRENRVTKPLDLKQTLRSAFGFRIEPVAVSPSVNSDALFDRVLSFQPADQGYSTAQQEVINDRLKSILAKPALNADDFALIGRLVSDRRIDDSQIGITFQAIFRKHRLALTPLVPAIIARLEVPVPEQRGHYQNALGWVVASYPAQTLRSNREQIVAILDQQPDWPTSGLLSRVAEISGDASELIARRLESKSNTVRQMAAVAACRASPEAWPALEPIVLAHLQMVSKSNRIRDDEGPLLLALMRFGKKPLVEQMIGDRDLSNKEALLQRLQKMEQGFDPENCRRNL